MDNNSRSGGMSYAVTVTRQDEQHAVATTREHELTLNVRKGDGRPGFNAAETLLAALGACILTNVQAIAAKMRLPLVGAEVRFQATRQDEPPALTHITYELMLDSPAPPEKLEELYHLAVKWGTVMNTLSGGLTPEGSLTIRDNGQERKHE
ncbi:MAG: OsmC family protein [Chloroflexota bacterium]